MMRVWVFNHYAESANGAATRTFDLSRGLTARGHEVTVFACSFSHYRLREEHLTRWWQVSRVDVTRGVRFVWVRGTPYRENDWRRALNMVQYAMLAFVSGLRTQPRPDVVVGCSVHPLAALVALAIARIRRARFFVEVPDLWPQVLVDFGRLHPRGFTARTLYWIEKLLYRHAERIIMLWRNTHSYVGQLGIDPGKLVWIPHAVDPIGQPGPPPSASTGLFTAMYVGSFVGSMALDTVVDAAVILHERERTDIRLVLVGGGTDRSRLLSRVEALNLPNLVIRPPVPRSDVPSLLQGADCLICTFKNSPVYRYGLSMNKVCDYLLSAKPIVFAGSSAYDPVAEAGAGISIGGEDPGALAGAVERLADASEEQRRAMGQSGLRWVIEHHHVNVLAHRLESVLAGSY